MFLTLFAFAVAFVFLVRSAMLGARVRRLREERDALAATVEAQRRRIEALGGNEPGFGIVASIPAVAPASAPGPGPQPHSAGVQAIRPVAGLPAGAPTGSPIPPPPVGESRGPARLLTQAADEASATASPTGQVEGIPAPTSLATDQAPGSEDFKATFPSEEPAADAGAAPSDWESFLGIKGAAWMAGVAFMLSAIFFARWIIQEGLVTAQVSFGVMLLAGVLALVSGEALSRVGLARATSPVLSAGLAILYVAFMAAHVRYGLIGAPAAFGALIVVTVIGGLVAVRHSSFAAALLSLLGGIATAFALAVDEEKTIAAFAAVLLVNAGLLPVVARRPWFGLLRLGLVGSLALETRWFWSSLSPASMGLGVAIIVVFGIFYLVMPVAAGEDADRRLLRVSALGALAPFLFAIPLATSARYLDQWPELFGMMTVLNVATLIVAVRCRRAPLLRRAAVASGLILAWWALQGLKADSGVSLFGSTLFAVAIVSVFGLARRAALRFGTLDESSLVVLESSALAAGIGLGLFGVVMVLYDRGAPVGPFLTLATALVLLLIEMSDHEGRLRGALAVGALGLATITQIWLFSAVNASTLVSYLAGPVVVSLLLWVLAERRARRGFDLEAEIAVQAAGWISILGLFLALVATDRTSTGWPAFLPLASTGWPLFGALLIQVTVVIASVLRSNWTLQLPALLGASALHILVWQRSYLSPDQHATVLGFSLLIYGTFLLLPLARFERWREDPAPWIASALAGPAFYFPLRALYRAAVGEASIGLLPLALTAVSIACLAEVSRRFVAAPGDAAAIQRRLRALTLYSVVAFWFVAAAIQIQFHRQWVTLGWALEAVVLLWLFERLPHQGLVAFASVLFALVGARLLFNPAVLGYEQRGLPVANWLLYTYGIAGASCYAAQRLLRRGSPARWIRLLADAVALLGLLLSFWLVNLEILDYFSPGEYITLSGHEGYAVKLAFSVGWGVFAVALLAAGVARNVRALRYLSLAFMILTVAKVFLYDLAALEGFFQVFSFFGLAAGLLLISFFYQRFVFGKHH